MNIRAIRDQYGYTQEKLAELLDVSVSTVRKWEQTETNPGKRSKKDIIKLFPDVNEINAFFKNESVYENIDKIVNQEEV